MMENRFSYFFPKEKIVKKTVASLKKNTILKKALSTGKTAYLTFDDGPSEQTEKILNVLQRYNIKATFFVLGVDTVFGRNMYKRIVDEGHQLGNHTYTHDYRRIYSSLQNFLADFMRLENLVKSVTGKGSTILRYPGGSNNRVSSQAVMRQIIAEIERRGYTHFDWNVDAGDATSALNNPSLIVRNVLEQAQGKDNAIVLFHDASYQKHTPNVLPQIIEGLRKQGFGFGVLSENSYRVQFVKP